jgi:hypothetical protein
VQTGGFRFRDLPGIQGIRENPPPHPFRNPKAAKSGDLAGKIPSVKPPRQLGLVRGLTGHPGKKTRNPGFLKFPQTRP